MTGCDLAYTLLLKLITSIINLVKTVAKVLIYDNQGQILVLERSDTHPNFSGHLDLPGGEVELGELSPEAAAREVLEETGLSIVSDDLILLFEKHEKKQTKHVLFRVVLSQPEPPIILTWEHKAYMWLDPAELLQRAMPDSVDSYYRNVIEFLEKS